MFCGKCRQWSPPCFAIKSTSANMAVSPCRCRIERPPNDRRTHRQTDRLRPLRNCCDDCVRQPQFWMNIKLHLINGLSGMRQHATLCEWMASQKPTTARSSIAIHSTLKTHIEHISTYVHVQSQITISSRTHTANMCDTGLDCRQCDTALTQRQTTVASFVASSHTLSVEACSIATYTHCTEYASYMYIEKLPNSERQTVYRCFVSALRYCGCVVRRLPQPNR